MKITKSQERTTQVLDLIRETFSKPREGIHLSDLLYPRRAFWQKVKPLPPSDTDIQYWLAGRGHEDAMHRVTGLVHVSERVREEIRYGIDFFDGHPVEMKTRRRYLAKEGNEADVYQHYLSQLLGYCALENIPSGELWVWSLVEKDGESNTAPKYVAYKVEFAQEELDRKMSELRLTRDMLVGSLSSGEMTILLPLCPEWMCVKRTTEVFVKPRCITCNRDFETDWGINKHTSSKSGDGHKVVKTVYKTITAPQCRWYEDCRPYEIE